MTVPAGSGPGTPTLEAEGFVLAGGQSSRMGTDKAWVRFGREPLIVHALRTLCTVCPQVRIAGGSPELTRYARVVPDSTRFQGPLGGIVAALTHATADWCLFTPVDTPLLPPDALRRLLTTPHPQGTVAILAQPADHTNPLVAVYHRRCLPVLAAELAAGRLRVRAAIETAGPVAYCHFTAPQEHLWFRNLNSPADLLEVMPRD